MEGRDGSSRARLMGGIAGAIVLAGLLAALSTAVINGFTSSVQPQDILRRTPTPTNTGTATRTPTITRTPTNTSTSTPSRTPTSTVTPFTPKSANELLDTVMIGGSTGSTFLSFFNVSYVPMFDGAVGGTAGSVEHLTLPGTIRHLEVLLDRNLLSNESYRVTIVKNGQPSDVTCDLPTKKADFCTDSNKNHCLDAGKQDQIAVQVVPLTQASGSQVAGDPNGPRMSWVAKLDLFATCPV